MADALMYKKARALEFNTGVKLYSLSPWEQAKKSKRAKQLEVQLKDLQAKRASMDPETYEEQETEITSELQTLGGSTIYGSKIGDVLMTITQLKALSYNPFSAAANLTFGLVSAMTHANGRVDFDHTAVLKSFALVLKHATRKSITAGAWSSPTSKKIFNILEKSGVMAEIVDSQYGKTNVPNIKDEWKTKLSPYTMMRTSDYFMRALNTVAFMMHQKTEVTKTDGTKETQSLWEAFDENGDYKYQDEGWNDADEDKRVDWNKFRNRAIRVNSVIMGNMDRNSPVWTKKYVLGRLLSQFRLSWLGEGMAARYEREKWDEQLGRIVKGRYRTYADMGVGGSMMVLGKQLLSILPGTKINPFDVNRRDDTPMDDVDIENMRRNFAELAFAVTLLTTMAMLGWMDADDEDKWKFQLVINMLTRTHQDIQFYVSPDAFNTVFNRAVPAVNTLNDYQKAMSATWKVLTNDEYKWDRWVLAMTRAGIPIPQAALYNKMKYMTERDLGSINN